MHFFHLETWHWIRCHVGDIPRQNRKTTKKRKSRHGDYNVNVLKIPHILFYTMFESHILQLQCPHWQGALGVAVSSIKLLPICTSNTGKVGWKSTGADPRNTTCCSILCGMGDCNLAHVRAMPRGRCKGFSMQRPVGIQWRVSAKKKFRVCESVCKHIGFIAVPSFRSLPLCFYLFRRSFGDTQDVHSSKSFRNLLL